MNIDLDKIRADIDKLSRKAFDNYKIKKGMQIVRILPPFDASGIFYVRVPMHWNIAGKHFPCERAFDSICPACEAASMLLSKGYIKEKVKVLFPRDGCVFNMLDMSPTTPPNARGPFVTRFPKVVSSIILSFIMDPSYAGLLDPQNGRNITITRISDTGNNPPDQVYPAAQASPIPPEYIGCLNSLSDLNKVATRVATGDIEVAVMACVSGMGSPTQAAATSTQVAVAQPASIIQPAPAQPVAQNPFIPMQSTVAQPTPPITQPDVNSKLQDFLSNMKVYNGGQS